MPLPLTVSCSSKILIGSTFLVPAHLGSPRKRAVKWVCVYYWPWQQRRSVAQWASRSWRGQQSESAESPVWWRRRGVQRPSPYEYASTPTRYALANTKHQLGYVSLNTESLVIIRSFWPISWQSLQNFIKQHNSNDTVIGVSWPPVLDCGTTFHPDYRGRRWPSTPSDDKLIYLSIYLMSQPTRHGAVLFIHPRSYNHHTSDTVDWMGGCSKQFPQLNTHTLAHNHLTAFCLGLPGYTGTRRNIHPLTPILIIGHPLSSSSIYYDLQHPPCSNLRAWQSFCTTSLWVLIGLPLC